MEGTAELQDISFGVNIIWTESDTGLLRDYLHDEGASDLEVHFLNLFKPLGCKNKEDIKNYVQKNNNIGQLIDTLKLEIRNSVKKEIQKMSQTKIGQETYKLIAEQMKEGKWKIDFHPFIKKDKDDHSVHGTTDNEKKTINLYGFGEMDSTLIHEVNHIKIPGFLEGLKETFKEHDLILKFIAMIEEIKKKLFAGSPKEVRGIVEQFLNENLPIKHLEKEEGLTYNDLFQEVQLTEKQKAYFSVKKEDGENLFLFPSKKEFYEHLANIESGKNSITLKEKDKEDKDLKDKKKQKQEGEKIHMPLDSEEIKSIIEEKLTPAQRKEYEMVKLHQEIKKLFEIKHYYESLKEGKEKMSEEERKEAIDKEIDEELTCRGLEVINGIEKIEKILPLQTTELYENFTKKIESNIALNLLISH